MSTSLLTFRIASGVIMLLSPTNQPIAILSENQNRLLQNAATREILRHLQEPMDLATLVARTRDAIPPAQVLSIVQELYSTQFITIHPHLGKRHITAYWDKLFSPGPQRSLSVLASMPEFGKRLKDLLYANGVTLNADSELIVLAAGDYLSLSDNMLHNLRSKPVLLAKPVGTEVWIGPLLLDGSICWNCLRYWLALRRWPEMIAMGGIPEAFADLSIGWLPSTLTTAAGLIATACTLLCAAPEVQPRPWISLVSTAENAERNSPVLGRRDCPRCVPVPADPGPDYLAFLCDDRTGILENTRVSETAIGPVYLANSSVLLPLAYKGARAALPPLSVDGKGRDRREAMSRCLMEGIERYSSAFAGDEQVFHARAADLDSITPPEILLYSAAQFSGRAEWNARPGSMHGIPEPFNPDQEIGWIPAESLDHSRRVYLPAGCVYLWYPFGRGYPLRRENFYNFADTNGCAAAITREEATLNALLELIERDAVSIWWHNRLRRPGIELHSWDDPQAQESLRLFVSASRTLELLDLTHDFGIPVFAAVSAEADGTKAYYGCAAHTCAVTAARKALAELIQFWFWDQQSQPTLDRNLWLAKSSFHRHPYLQSDRLISGPTANPLTIAESLTLCSAALQRSGLEAFVADLTRPEIGVPAVRIIAPGLQHFGPRFEGPRLFQVPVKLGWLDNALDADDMNPDLCVF